MKVVRLTLALALVSLMAGLVLAQTPSERPAGPRGPGGRGPGGFGGPGAFSPFERMTDAVKKLDLTPEQTAKFEALKKEYAPKFKALREKMESVMKEGRTLADEARPKLMDILTDEQKAKLKDAMGPGLGGRRGGRGRGQDGNNGEKPKQST